MCACIGVGLGVCVRVGAGAGVCIGVGVRTVVSSVCALSEYIRVFV